MKPHRGAIALCAKGEVGLITSECPQPNVDRRDGYIYFDQPMKWRGIHLSPDKFGRPWSSQEPEVLDGATFHMADILEALKPSFDVTEKV